MRNLKLMKAELIIGGKEITSIQNVIKNAGKDITGTIKVVAQVLAGIVGAVAGLVLLFMIVKTLFKSHRGDGGAWDEAAQTIAVCIICLAFSAAVFTAFF